ncbi:MAG: class I SAM-dependent DNA methyltransferase [Pyrinomonadaceae bacterium]
MQAAAYRKLSEIVERFNGSRTIRPEAWAHSLFESLDWGDRSTFAIEPDNDKSYHLLVDNVPVVSVLPESPDNVESVYYALNRAYNQDVPWVVATDFYSLGLFGSYWISFKHDIQSATALRIKHSEYLAEAHQLELLTPRSVARNEIGELYSAFPGRKRRIPIDRHLVVRMEQWRRLALHALGTDALNADPLIHRLINTLFLIRYLEDTGKTSEQSLQKVASETNGEKFTRQLRGIFDRIAKRTRYNVPTREELNNLQQTPLRNLIQQLYGYPDYGIIYDFAAMNVDILGRFYEEYLRRDVVPVQETRAVLTLFEPPSYEMEDVRKQRGVYFTPRYIVDFILNSLIERFKAHSSRKLPVVLDMAAGSGTFLSAAVDHLLKAYPRIKTEPTELVNNLIGLDVDVRAIEAAKFHLTAKLIGEGVPEPIPQLKLSQVDLIFGGPNQPQIKEILSEGGADVIVGNPPYIQYERLKKHYEVSDFFALFETATGRTDSYIMFVEAAVKLLKDGGFGGLVLPNSILRTSAAGTLRQWLTKRADILEIIDFLEQPVFQAVNAYVCLLLFRKRSAESPSTSSRDVTVAKVYKLSETPASQLAGISVLEEPPEGCEVFRINQPTGKGPWDLKNKAEVELLDLIKNASDETVGDVLTLRQGVKTGADNIFVVEASPLDTDLFILHGSPKAYKLERELLVPVLRNRDLRRWGARAKAFLIYPYDMEAQRPLTWKTIERKYRGIAAYLESHQDALSKRKSRRGEYWYELIEPRLATIASESPQIVAAEIGLRPVICKVAPSGSAIVGNAWLMLKNESYELDVLMAYLNSAVAEWYLRQVSPLLHGGYILLRQSNISRLPLPRFLKDKDSFIYGELKRLSTDLSGMVLNATNLNHPQLRVEVKKTEEQIDSLIMEAMGFKASHGEELRKFNSITRRAASRAKNY